MEGNLSSVGLEISWCRSEPEVLATEVVKVGGVEGATHHGLDGWLHLTELQKIQALEEAVSADLVGREPVLGVADEAANEVPCLLADTWGGRQSEVLPPALHARHDNLRVVAVVGEGRPAKQHLVGDNAHGPEVALPATRAQEVDLWGSIVRSADQRPQLWAWRVASGLRAAAVLRPQQRRPGQEAALGCGLRGVSGAEPEVHEAYVAPRVEDHVVGLYVAVDVVECSVDVIHGLHKLCNVEAGFLLTEDALPLEVRHEVSAGHVVHHHVQVCVILEGAVQSNDPIVFRPAHGIFLVADMANLVLSDHLHLAHLLERKDLARALLPA
mmetsp:Transcript_69419/g.192068  ORF Transcript_69419/g.192068 Transcript_69419/m.192068 type:complete len:327 (+) Transcript_69419:414-1394(+)